MTSSGYFSNSPGIMNSLIGGIVGDNYAKVINCYNIGTVSTKYNVSGGIIGINREESTLRNCYNIGRIDGTTFVGGIVGYNKGNIEGICYYLDSSAEYGANDVSNINEIKPESNEYMKSVNFLTQLNSYGKIFKLSDKEDNSYPIFYWQ